MRPALCMLIALIAGCETLDDRAQHLTGPEVIEWQSDEAFVVTAQPEMKGSLNLSGGELKVYLTGFPPNTQVTLGEQTLAVRDNGAANLAMPMSGFFGSVSTKDFLRGQVEGATLKLEAPGQPGFTLPLPPQEALLLDKHLLGVTEGPLLYVGEEAVAATPPKTLFWHHGADNELLGVPASTLAQIDAIGVLESSVAETRVCPGYKGEDGAVRDLTLELIAHTVKVYDRRTGAVTAEQSFAPVDRCPDSTFQFEGESFKTTTVLPEADIRAWLNTVVGQQAPAAE